MHGDFATKSFPFAIPAHTLSIDTHTMVPVSVATNVTNASSVASLATIKPTETGQTHTGTVDTFTVGRAVVAGSASTHSNLTSRTIVTRDASTLTTGKALTLPRAVSGAQAHNKHARLTLVTILTHARVRARGTNRAAAVTRAVVGTLGNGNHSGTVVSTKTGITSALRS